jgi:hypothetical protein
MKWQWDQTHINDICLRQLPAVVGPSARQSIPNVNNTGLTLLLLGRVRSCDCGSLGCRHRENRAASSASFATVFMLRAVPDLAAGMTSFELPIPLP